MKNIRKPRISLTFFSIELGFSGSGIFGPLKFNCSFFSDSTRLKLTKFQNNFCFCYVFFNIPNRQIYVSIFFLSPGAQMLQLITLSHYLQFCSHLLSLFLKFIVYQKHKKILWTKLIFHNFIYNDRYTAATSVITPPPQFSWWCTINYFCDVGGVIEELPRIIRQSQ